MPFLVIIIVFSFVIIVSLLLMLALKDCPYLIFLEISLIVCYLNVFVCDVTSSFLKGKGMWYFVLCTITLCYVIVCCIAHVHKLRIVLATTLRVGQRSGVNLA